MRGWLSKACCHAGKGREDQIALARVSRCSVSAIGLARDIASAHAVEPQHGRIITAARTASTAFHSVSVSAAAIGLAYREFATGRLSGKLPSTSPPDELPPEVCLLDGTGQHMTDIG